MKPEQLVEARADMCAYLNACKQTLKYIISRYSTLEKGERAYGIWENVADEAELLVITPDIFALAVDTLETTGIMDEWQDLLPLRLLVVFPEPLSDVAPGFNIAPMEMPEAMAGGIQGRDTVKLPSRASSMFLVASTTEGFSTAPVIPLPELRGHVQEAMATLRQGKHVIDMLEKKYFQETDIRSYYAAFQGMSMDHVPVLFGDYKPILPKGLSMKALSRCRREAYCVEPEDALPVCLIAAAYALAREPKVAEQTRTRVTIKKPVKRKQSEVSVIRLRRTQPSAPTGRKYRPRDHRYIVSGHFRNQAYGKGHKQRKRVWIAPYIAGPEDKPLRIREKVHVL